MAYAATPDLVAEVTADAPHPAPRTVLTLAALQALEHRSDLRGGIRLGTHFVCMGGTSVLVWLASTSLPLLLPAMFLHGITIVTMFAPMHECVHRTAFASRRVNDAVAWLAGLLSVYNSTFYRYYHGWHHRYTQDPARDPELMYPRATDRLHYALEVSGLAFWWRRLIDYPAIALGRVERLPFIPPSVRRRVAWSMWAQLTVYLAGAASLAFGSTAFLIYWFFPALLATPFLRSLLIAEHTGCSRDRNGLTNTRTTLTLFPIRLLMWNMPFHAEHHLYPSVPFHQLPALHGQVRDKLVHIGGGYVAVNQQIIRTL